MKFNPVLPASHVIYLVPLTSDTLFLHYKVHRATQHSILGTLVYSAVSRSYSYRPMETLHSHEELQAIESFLAVLNDITRHFFPEGHEYTGGVR